MKMYLVIAACTLLVLFSCKKDKISKLPGEVQFELNRQVLKSSVDDETSINPTCRKVPKKQ